MRPAALLVAAVLFLGACSVTEPTPPISPTALPTETASPTEAATEEPSASPSPGPDDVPIYIAGQKLASNAPGLRVRSRPGTDAPLIASLPENADLLAEMGPVTFDGFGWYSVVDADPDKPEFSKGWVAAGFEPDPFIVPSDFELNFNPYIAGFAHDGNGEFGPVRVVDANHGIRWVAAPQDADGCSFAVDLRPGSGTAVQTIRATIGGVPAPGDVYSDFFTAHPELIGDVFVVVTSDCSWAITFVRFIG
jgi:hypothetical protein